MSAFPVLLDEAENLESPPDKSKLNIYITVLEELSRSWVPARHTGNNVHRLHLWATLNEMFL